MFKPEAERTPGEQLLATQVLTGGGGGTPERARDVDDCRQKWRRPRSSARRSRRSKNSGRRRCRWRRSSPTATGGFIRTGSGDETIGCPKCRLPPPDKPNGTLLHEGPGKYVPPPTHFLIRGDPDSKGSLMQPGFLQVAHARRASDGNSAAGRTDVGPPPRAGRVDRVAARIR